MAKKIEAYKCEQCNSIWETEQDAIECETSHENEDRSMTLEEVEASMKSLREMMARYKNGG